MNPKTTIGFFLNVSLNLVNSLTKIFVITVKGLEPDTQPPLTWETRKLQQRQQYTCRDRIFKLSLVHASVNITNNLHLYSCRVTQEARLCAEISIPRRRSGSYSGSPHGEMTAVMSGSPGSIPGYSDTSPGFKIFWTRTNPPIKQSSGCLRWVLVKSIETVWLLLQLCWRK